MNAPKTYSLLLTEDSATQADRLAQFLRGRGYEVTWVPGGEEALQALAGSDFDLVITDILMPGMDGYGLCRAIKTDPALQGLPVILLTALSDPGDILKGLECGADSFVPKHYEEEFLLSRIRFTLENAERSRQGGGGEGGKTRIAFRDQLHFISSGPGQIVNFLLGAYEIALRKNEESTKVREDLERLNARLEDLVEERTSALREEIRERQRMHENLLRTEEKLRHAAKMEAVGQLAGGIAHDFNNLMTAVNGYSALLLERFTEPGEERDFLRLIKEAGERASQLTGQLLAFGRKQMLTPKVTDLNESVNSICALMERLIGSHIRIERRQRPDLWKTKVDPAQMEQVLMNLMINARDAMPEGGTLSFATDNIALGLDSGLASELAPGEYVQLSVSDTGMGMDESLQARIFEPFFSTKGRLNGSGLGLATSYGIIKQSGGHITVQSRPGQGAVFRIYLPRSLPEPDAKPSPGTLPRLPSHGGDETILVAEDEDAVRKLVVGLLELKGYRVLAAPDGKAALDLASREKGRIHLLLTDLTMPRLSGPELARRLIQARPGLPVLYMSGFSEEIANPRVGEKGMEFIPKPFTSQNLWTRIRRILDRAADSGVALAPARSGL